MHGLGFAGFLADSLVQEERKLIALAGFNLGVELGQLAVIALLAALLIALPKTPNAEDRYLAPRPLRILGCIAIAGVGLYWFFERV